MVGDGAEPDLTRRWPRAEGPPTPASFKPSSRILQPADAVRSNMRASSTLPRPAGSDSPRSVRLFRFSTRSPGPSSEEPSSPAGTPSRTGPAA